MNASRVLMAVPCTLLFAACDSGAAPEMPTSVSLAVTAPAAAPATTALPRTSRPAAAEVVQSDGTSTLVLTRVALVLREVELKRALANDCDTAGQGGDDSCEEFAAGPMILEVPLDGTVRTVVAVDAPADLYDEIEFDVHKPDDDSPEDQAFLLANPDFLDTSVLVEGTWNGEPFRFTQDLNEEQEIELSPPLRVEAGGTPVTLTMALDVTTWFVRADGSLIEPATANKGGMNEGLVEENIRRSIDAFRDDDEDGSPDD